jgi:hypothetical protein
MSRQLIKIIFAKSFALFQAFTAYYKAFYNKLPEGFGCPDTELGGLMAVYPVANGYDGIEVVKLYIPLYHTTAFLLNCFQNGNS